MYEDVLSTMIVNNRWLEDEKFCERKPFSYIKFGGAMETDKKYEVMKVFQDANKVAKDRMKRSGSGWVNTKSATATKTGSAIASGKKKTAA